MVLVCAKIPQNATYDTCKSREYLHLQISEKISDICNYQYLEKSAIFAITRFFVNIYQIFL